MRTRDRERIHKDWQRRAAAVLRCLYAYRDVANAPSLPQDVSISRARRTVERLRSGAMRPADPRVSPLLVADLIERSIAKIFLMRWCVAELSESFFLWNDINVRCQNERVKRLVEGFHRLKKSPQAGDPFSTAANRYRFLHRERRNELGRPPRRREA